MRHNSTSPWEGIFTERQPGRLGAWLGNLDLKDPAPFSKGTSCAFTHLQLRPTDVAPAILAEYMADVEPRTEATAMDAIVEDIMLQLQDKEASALAWILQEVHHLDLLDPAMARRLQRIVFSHQPDATHWQLDYKDPAEPGTWVCTIRLQCGFKHLPLEMHPDMQPLQLAAQLKVVAPVLLPDELPAFKFPYNARP